ncbi:hypothetical protein Golob_017776 [Gossypium lobatum]|uniref:Uncharacterized protein n=1 Tax=Gossypium lobatum TaxID=34289 RepID=A0A7J8M898_9ROSI|nr:hypothetical protein [Gossypium lobatum]
MANLWHPLGGAKSQIYGISATCSKFSTKRISSEWKTVPRGPSITIY